MKDGRAIAASGKILRKDMKLNDDAFRVGATFSLVSTVVPDWLVGSVTKLVLAAITAVVSGLGYMAGVWLWGKIKGKLDSTKDESE